MSERIASYRELQARNDEAAEEYYAALSPEQVEVVSEAMNRP